MTRIAVLVLLGVTIVSGLTALGCGSFVQTDRFSGDWQRVRAGVVDPQSMLHVRADGAIAQVTFEDRAAGTRVKTQAAPEGDVLRCTLPLGADEGPPVHDAEASPETLASRTASDHAPLPVQLSLDESGEALRVDLLGPGDQLIPLWTYVRWVAD